MEDMANQLLRARSVCNGCGTCSGCCASIGKLWASRFTKRRPELRMRWAHTKDYQRAKCEDLVVYSRWFTLVQNVRAKYGIPDSDVYNFDETSFMIGVIFNGMVVITSEGRGRAQLV